MPEFAQGLVLEVPNRDQFKKYVQNNAHDPAVQFESWGANSVPEALVVVDYRHDDENPYYKCLDKHVNGRVSTTY